MPMLSDSVMVQCGCGTVFGIDPLWSIHLPKPTYQPYKNDNLRGNPESYL